jgi:hypothetical protein
LKRSKCINWQASLVSSLHKLLIAIAVLFAAPNVEALERRVTFVQTAIKISAPNLTKSTSLRYAKHIRMLAIEHSFDPLTMIAMVQYESHWQPGLKYVRGNEEYVGLLQIRLRNRKACQADRFTVECDAIRRSLVEPLYNLTLGARYITTNRGFCREKVGSALFAYWLASFQGFNSPAKKEYCGHKLVRGRWRPVKRAKLTQRVMTRRLELIKATERRLRK